MIQSIKHIIMAITSFIEEVFVLELCKDYVNKGEKRLDNEK